MAEPGGWLYVRGEGGDEEFMFTCELCSVRSKPLASEVLATAFAMDHLENDHAGLSFAGLIPKPPDEE